MYANLFCLSFDNFFFIKWRNFIFFEASISIRFIICDANISNVVALLLKVFIDWTHFKSVVTPSADSVGETIYATRTLTRLFLGVENFLKTHFVLNDRHGYIKFFLKNRNYAVDEGLLNRETATHRFGCLYLAYYDFIKRIFFWMSLYDGQHCETVFAATTARNVPWSRLLFSSLLFSSYFSFIKPPCCRL